jgi:hypothetical protein
MCIPRSTVFEGCGHFDAEPSTHPYLQQVEELFVDESNFWSVYHKDIWF